MQRPTAYLIGAGPGDPGLLTLRGAQCLRMVDVVLYDGLSNETILGHAPNALHECVGKHGMQRYWTQEEIIQRMLHHLHEGRSVARLKGGDPAVFARTAEEATALKEAGFPFVIVPGITAALAAGSYAGIPVTHRQLASAVALVTGHEQPGKPESALDWDALAQFPGTLVIYMGVTTAATWTAALLQAGKPPETPAAIVRRCSLPDQQIIHCHLDEVAQHLTPATKLRPPVIVILGPVTELAETLSWFPHRELSGRRVLVTRPAEQADGLAEPLRELGADVLVQPAIAILPPDDWAPLDQAIGNLNQGDTLVFASRNGVQFFFARLHQQAADARRLAGVRVVAVGSKTADALATRGIRADLVPERFDAEGLIDLLCQRSAGLVAHPAGFDAELTVGQRRGPAPANLASERSIPSAERFFLIRASRGRDRLAEALQSEGQTVQQVIAYRNTDVTDAAPQIRRAIERQAIDWVTVTSSAIANSLHQMFGQDLRRVKLASISPTTSQTLRNLGLNVTVEAKSYTMDGLVEAIVEYERASTND